MTGNLPFKRDCDIFNQSMKVLAQLTGTRLSLFSHEDVGKCCEVIVTVNLQNSLILKCTQTELLTYNCCGHVANHILFALISSNIYFADKFFSHVDPLFFPFLLSKVFELFFFFWIIFIVLEGHSLCYTSRL